jgi:small-conductance mechanosensitive channel/CRP-like cAMP-binding protein
MFLHYPVYVAVGVAGFLLTLAIRALTVNRLIRSKLRLSLLVLAAYVAINVFLATSPVSGEFAARVRSIEELLVALAAINLLVVLAINPFRADRVPERFPNIVQDAIIIGLFLIVATAVMQEKFLTTSAVGAVVIGFALQDTLGNMFAGLAIQVEKPFRVGHWITVGSFEGLVSEITWRATKLKTKAGNFVILPNNIISKEAITNYSDPVASTRLQVEVGASYDVPPNEVRAAITEALAEVPMLLTSPPPEVVVVDFGASAVTYRVKFWIDDYAADDRARDQVRTAIYYMFRRRGIEIPYPIQTYYRREAKVARAPETTGELGELLQAVDIFAPLGDEGRIELLASATEQLYGAGETVVRQGDPASSMFVIVKGRARVTVEPSGREVATIEQGGYFGEMSLLTGDPRSASVAAITDCLLLEITADAFRRVALAHPAVVEQVTLAVEGRREGLERTKRVAVAPVAQVEQPRSFLARVQQFLRLPGAERRT